MKPDDLETADWPAPSEGAEVTHGHLVFLFCLLAGLAAALILAGERAS